MSSLTSSDEKLFHVWLPAPWHVRNPALLSWKSVGEDYSPHKSHAKVKGWNSVSPTDDQFPPVSQADTLTAVWQHWDRARWCAAYLNFHWYICAVRRSDLAEGEMLEEAKTNLRLRWGWYAIGGSIAGGSASPCTLISWISRFEQPWLGASF